MTPTWQSDDGSIRLVHGDCLHVLPELEAGSVDLVFTSPPYEAARTYGIDFNLNGQDWVNWCFERYVECLRVCKGLVAWVVEGQSRQFRYSAAPALLMADLHRAGVHLRKPPVFHRVGIPGSGGPDWLRNDWEWIICATSGGKLPWSDNVAMGHPPKWAPGGEMSYRNVFGERVNETKSMTELIGARGSNRRRADGTREKMGRKLDRTHTKTKADGSKETQGYVVPAKANPGNVIHCKVGGGVMGSPLAHENEAPFPESLAEFFVRSFCPEDGIVLDPFSGSGTTAAVAVKNGRQAIGIDVRESQVDIAVKRIEAELQQRRLFV